MAAKLSVKISRKVRDEAIAYVRAHGVDPNAFVEQALLHRLQAARELPEAVDIRIAAAG